MAAPPLLAGAVKLIVACVSPAEMASMVGAPGGATGGVGVTFTAAEACPVPLALVAVTEQR